MSDAEIRIAVEQFPELTDFGFGVFDGKKLSPEARRAELQRNRDLMFLPRSIQQFSAAKAWLQRQLRTKNVNKSAGSSYGLKHVAEKEIGYVTNGIFIAAAIATGFTIQRANDGPNAWLNISKRSRT